MNNFVRNNPYMIVLKIIAALFQIPATWHVFTVLFQEAGRSRLESYITTVFAILLIDAFFLAVLYLLESAELTPLDKLPWALVGVGLLVANLAIGFMDEGWLAWGPRVGFIGLVLADLFAWVTDIISQYFSREQVEIRLRNKQVMQRRRIMNKAWEEAVVDLYDDLVVLQQQREIRQLGLDAPVARIVPEQQVKLLDTGLMQEHELEEGVEVEEHIYYSSQGYYWVSPFTGEAFYATSTGKPYTLRGAKQALTRHSNQYQNQEEAW